VMEKLRLFLIFQAYSNIMLASIILSNLVLGI